jgi:hypothetical protein
MMPFSISGLVLHRLLAMLVHEAADPRGDALVQVEELESDPIPALATGEMHRKEVPDRGPKLGDPGAVDQPKGLDGTDGEGGDGLDERALGGQVADPHRLERLDRTPEFTDNLEARGTSPVG